MSDDSKQIRILTVDDHPILRQGIAMRPRSHPRPIIGLKRGIIELWFTRNGVKKYHLEFAAGFGRL